MSSSLRRRSSSQSYSVSIKHDPFAYPPSSGPSSSFSPSTEHILPIASEYEKTPTSPSFPSAGTSSSDTPSRVRLLLLPATWLVLALGVAAAHHFFYSWAADQPVVDVPLEQRWLLSIGNAAAFVYAICIAEATKIGLTKLLWESARTEYKTLEDHSTAFSLEASILSMLNGALWKSGRLLLLLALLLRLTSIPGIFVVPTLTAQLVSTNTTSTCSVPIFQAGEIKQEVDEIEYTWTLSGVTAYAQPSSLLSSLSSRVLASSSPLLTLPSSCPGSSSVSNCTFSTTVDALTYQCSGETFQGYEYTGQTVLYHAVDAPEYKEADTAAVAQNDCLSIRLPTQNDALKCCPYHASFEVSVTQEGAERNSVTLLSEPKVGDKLWSYGSEYDVQVSGDGVDGFLTDAHLWAVKDSVMRLLLGKVHVDFDQKVPSVNETRIDVTPNKDMYDARNIEKPTSVDGLLKTLPELMNNISLSLLSLTPSTTSTSCVSHPYALTYVYTPLVLISAYALGLLFSLLAVLLGTKLFTLHFPAQNTFKDFVLASRNSGLDGLVEGREGTWKVREEAAKEKLRLGAMKDGRLAFGTKEELVDSRG